MEQEDKEEAPYDCGPSSHLDRANLCLQKAEPEFLFYAALELRCFVESRQSLYLEAQEKYVKSIPRRWEIGKQAKELQQVYDRQEIQQAKVIFENGSEFIFRYVPVSYQLKKRAGRLGDYLHSTVNTRTQKNLTELREFLLETFEMASACQSGNLLSPLLLNVETGKPEGKFHILLTFSDQEEELKAGLEAGGQFKLQVEYHAIE